MAVYRMLVSTAHRSQFSVFSLLFTLVLQRQL